MEAGVTADLAEALQSVYDCMVFDSRDWGASRRDAWLYAIVVGWDADEAGETDDAMAELAARYCWTDETVERLRRMHAAVAGVLAAAGPAERRPDGVELPTAILRVGSAPDLADRRSERS
ncbi:hypothetical protein ACQP1P_38660 [Dactylosporangium sp. CA-052675]|uniref:hypothetical protein n=1 Tax=Dactylosporangium sp. CA-052675 TaxID=3239927 RepID=UPI003D90CF24